MKKSYHSTVVPIRLASVTSLRLRSSVTGAADCPGGIPPMAVASIASSSVAEARAQPESAVRCSDEIASARTAERRLHQRARLLCRDAIAFEACTDAECFEPRRETRRRIGERPIEYLREHRVAVRSQSDRAAEHERQRE